MKKKFDYDLIIVGGGIAGCKAALSSACKGHKVALIEKDELGGSDFNQTSVPMGALIEASQLLQQSVEGSRFGLSSKTLHFNFPSLRNWKNTACKRAKTDYKKLLADAGVDLIEGRGHLISDHEVSDGNRILKSKKVLLCMGAAPQSVGIEKIDGAECLYAQDVPKLTRLPKSVFIVGAGASGCEIAQYFAALGNKVLIADYAGRLLPREDEEIGQVLDYVFNSQKIVVLTQSRVMSIVKDRNEKRVIFLRGGLEKAVKVDEVILCTGYAPNTDCGLENAGVKYSRKGIEVNENLQTTNKNIYAAGDVIDGYSSLERCEAQALLAVKNIFTRKQEKYSEKEEIRSVKCYPEIARVGLSEDDCMRRDIKFRKLSLALGEVEKSNISDYSDGFIKILYNKKEKILGASIMAPNASLIIQEIALAIANDLSLADVARAAHSHFEWSQLVLEAIKQK